MDPSTAFGAFSLVARTVGAIRESGKRSKAKKEAENYLRRKYGLPTTEWSHSASTYTPGSPPDWASWRASAAELVRAILKSDDKEVSDEVRIYCGDLALLFLVMDTFALQQVEEFQTGETWKSLFEMGRGRGGSFALRLIKGELMDFCKRASLNVG